MSELLSKQNIWLYLFSVIFSSNLFAFTAQGFVKVFSDGGTKFNDKYVIAFFIQVAAHIVISLLLH